MRLWGGRYRFDLLQRPHETATCRTAACLDRPTTRRTPATASQMSKRYCASPRTVAMHLFTPCSGIALKPGSFDKASNTRPAYGEAIARGAAQQRVAGPAIALVVLDEGGAGGAELRCVLLLLQLGHEQIRTRRQNVQFPVAQREI